MTASATGWKRAIRDSLHAMARPVAMLTHSYYEEDPRVRREAEALVGAGRPVDVFALRREDDPAMRSSTASASTASTSSATRARACGRYLREYLDFLARAGGRR